MRILVAADSFKDALPAETVCAAIGRGLTRAGHQVRTLPLGDGGEGTARALALNTGGRLCEATVHDPLGRPVQASYGLSGDGRQAFIEMASASGLERLRPHERNPLHTSTYGTGELILHALMAQPGLEEIVLCIGGSATNDAGMGMAAALGYRFFDASGELLLPTGASLAQIERIDARHLRFDPGVVRVTVLCDVDNPLYGPRGAASVYAPQKGATPDVVEMLDIGLRHFAAVAERYFGRSVAEQPGAGAAGGLGAGAMLFLRGQLSAGAETVLRICGFADALADAELLITGEGRLDEQSGQGKLIGTLARTVAGRVPIIALCGSLQADDTALQRLGLQAAFAISRGPADLATALRETAFQLEQSAWNLGRSLLL